MQFAWFHIAEMLHRDGRRTTEPRTIEKGAGLQTALSHGTKNKSPYRCIYIYIYKYVFCCPHRGQEQPSPDNDDGDDSNDYDYDDAGVEC